MKQFLSQNKVILALAAPVILVAGYATFTLLRAESYILAVVFLFGMALSASSFAAGYMEDPKRSSKRAPYFMKLLLKFWAMPLETTRTRLLLSAWVPTFTVLSIYLGLGYALRLDDGGEINLTSMVLDGMRVMLLLPLLYWLFRRQYSEAPSNQAEGGSRILQKDDCPRMFSSSEIWIVALAAIVAVGRYG